MLQFLDCSWHVVRLKCISFDVGFLFCLCSEATGFLVEVLTPVDEDDRERCIDQLIEAIQKQPCKFSQAFCIEDLFMFSEPASVSVRVWSILSHRCWSVLSTP
jgi:DNA polymerases epsilon N terminal